MSIRKMNHPKTLAIALAAAGAVYLTRSAAASLITNGSFESGTYTLGSDGTAGLDNVNVSAVPEPASLAVIGIPAAMALLRRRRNGSVA